MRRLLCIAATLCSLRALAQTHIATDVEIRQMEEAARTATAFVPRVTARINLGELRRGRGESAAAQREFETALKIAGEERQEARRDLDMERYAIACAWTGVAHADLDRGAEAFADFEEAMRYDSDSAATWNLYSNAMTRLNRTQKAIGTARASVAAAARKASSSSVRDLLELDVYRFALAAALIDLDDPTDVDEAESILRDINASLAGDALKSLRKSIGKNEQFQIYTVATTDADIYLSLFNRSHLRLARIYEAGGFVEKARAEYEAVVSRRTDEPVALAGLARLAADPKERDRYLILSLDANPFAPDVIENYERLVASGGASPAQASGSVGSRLRLSIQQMHAHDFRGARATLQALRVSSPGNDVLQSLLARTELAAGDLAAARDEASKVQDAELRSTLLRQLQRAAPPARPRFLVEGTKVVGDPSEADLRAIVTLFAAKAIEPEDRATLDQAEFSSEAVFDQAFGGGTIRGVPFRFEHPMQFRGISSAAKPLRLVYRILGSTTVGGTDALLLEPIRVEARR